MRLAVKELQREQSDVLAFADRNREIVELPEEGKISSEFNLKSDEFSSAFLMPFSFEGGRRPTVL